MQNLYHMIVENTAEFGGGFCLVEITADQLKKIAESFSYYSEILPYRDIDELIGNVVKASLDDSAKFDNIKTRMLTPEESESVEISGVQIVHEMYFVKLVGKAYLKIICTESTEVLMIPIDDLTDYFYDPEN
jgi:hypothetical protein